MPDLRVTGHTDGEDVITGDLRGERRLFVPRISACAVVLLVILGFHTASAILCVQCDSDAGDTWCETNPPPAENCTMCLKSDSDNATCVLHGFDYCVIVRKFDENDTLLSFSRTCSPLTGNDACYRGRDREHGNLEVKICSTTCSTDGCNTAATVLPPHWVVILAAAVLSPASLAITRL